MVCQSAAQVHGVGAAASDPSPCALRWVRLLSLCNGFSAGQAVTINLTLSLDSQERLSLPGPRRCGRGANADGGKRSSRWHCQVREPHMIVHWCHVLWLEGRYDSSSWLVTYGGQVSPSQAWDRPGQLPDCASCTTPSAVPFWLVIQDLLLQ